MTNPLRIRLLVMSVFLLAGFTWTDTWAQAPNVISYSGVLTSPLGEPLDGGFNLTFRIYASPIGGMPLQPEQTINNVTVRKGLFNVLLGPFNPGVITEGSGERYIEVQVRNNPPLLPRQRLVSLPFALNALKATKVETVDGAQGGSISGGLTVSGGGLTVSGGGLTVNGNLGIGTMTPAGKLQVSGGPALFDGNVGIGTTNPQAKLDVNGDLKITGAIRTTGTPIYVIRALGCSPGTRGTLTLEATCLTERCGTLPFPSTPIYFTCDRICGGPVLPATRPVSCPNTMAGRLVAP